MGNSSSTNNTRTGRESFTSFDNFDIRRSFSSTINAPSSTYHTQAYYHPTTTTQSKGGSKIVPLVVMKDECCQTDEVRVESSTKRPKSYWPSLKATIVYVFLCYFSICFLFSFSSVAQSLLVYLHVLKWPPVKLQNLHRLGLNTARNVQFTTEDGLKLYGYHVLPPSDFWTELKAAKEWVDEDFDEALAHAERIIVYFHGNGGTRAFGGRIDILKQMANFLNAHVVSFDYRGFGDSEGWPSEEGTQMDSRSVIRWLDDIVTSRNILAEGYFPDSNNASLTTTTRTSNRTSTNQPYLYFYGHSLGTAIGAAMIQELNKNKPKTVSGLILDCPFSSFVEAARTHPLGWPFRVIPVIQNFIMYSIKFKYPTIERIGDIGAPLLLIHGARDIKIPKANSERLLKAALQSGNFEEVDYTKRNQENPETCERLFPVQLKEVVKAGHNGVYKTVEWIDVVPKFINQVEGEIKKCIQ